MILKRVIEDNPPLSQTPRLAENLRALLKKNHLNASQLAQKLSMPKMTIGRLLAGETTDPRISTLKLIADFFKVSLDDLMDADEQIILKTLLQNKSHLIPKLDWDILQGTNDLNKIDLSEWEAWQSVSLGDQQVGKNTFALESRPSMYPRFPQGTVFIIDPNLAPADGDIVLIKLKSNHELTLRELVIDPPEWQLHPVVKGAAIFHYSEKEHTIVGVNMLTMFYNRKEFV